MKSRKRVLLKILLAVLPFVAAAFLLLGLYRFNSVCFFNELTGLYCPGCGAGRFFLALFNGHPLAALKHNVMMPLYLGVLGYLFLGIYVSVYSDGRKKLPPLPRWAENTLLILIAVFAILRNISFFSFFAP